MKEKKSKVYFLPADGKNWYQLAERFALLKDSVRIEECICKGDMVAVKTHFGEPGNTAYLPPVYAGMTVKSIQRLGGLPFLTDTTTLYNGRRSNGVSHILSAWENGYVSDTVNAPIIIADGIRGQSVSKVSIAGEVLSEVEIANEIIQADTIVTLAHFTGHEVSGFGAVIKTLSMGCCSQRAKFKMHSTVFPFINTALCIGCGQCLKWCNFDAIAIKDKKALIVSDKCKGCGECIGVCPEAAIQINWKTSEDFHKLLVEHALGAVSGKEHKCIHFSFLTQMSPACDCYPFCDPPFVPDIGILASRDPVSIDKAAVDLVNETSGLACKHYHSNNIGPGEDKIQALYPHIDYKQQFDHAEKIGLGTTEYELIEV